ncbi:hypothetical protein P3875_09390 [Myroides sp. JBRI-B21084]|uniref:hypothetical protein n=1 Tax=Myroides sp. JBRI-B21084 TaxID=3119977 RepID=UPI0026E178E3|nr:hypothetical protein [Paenimyroides cloacae]WKW45989.1 hypothetical protein P3875_09390 [Paenimyroides cloacae]
MNKHEQDARDSKGVVFFMDKNKLLVILITLVIYFMFAYIIYYYFDVWQVFIVSAILAFFQSRNILKKY